MPSCGGLLEPRESKLTLLKSTFSAENFLCRLSWSILTNFGAVHSSLMLSFEGNLFTQRHGI